MSGAEVVLSEKKYRVELTKNTKGYSWSIKVSGDDDEELKTKLEELEIWCKEKYGSVE